MGGGPSGTPNGGVGGAGINNGADGHVAGAGLNNAPGGGQVGGAGLPRTGADLIPLSLVGIVLMILGAVLMNLRRNHAES